VATIVDMKNHETMMQVIRFRVNSKEHKAIKKLAKAEGVTVSDYLRKAIKQMSKKQKIA
jgi:predicted DNA binding CopG/RHH family protein